MLLQTAAADPLDHVEVVGRPALEAIGDEWNSLAGDIAFRRHEWLATWWRHYQMPGDELMVVALRDAGGTLTGLAPWYVTHSRWSGRVVRFLGSGKVCSEHLTVLCRAGAEAAVTRRLAEWLVDEARDLWDLIELTGVDGADPVAAELLRQMRLRGHTVHERRQHVAWRIELPGTFDEFLGRLSGKRRGRVRAAQRRMFDSGRAVARGAQSPADVRQGLDLLQRLHEQRRQSLGGSGCFSTPRFADFLHEAAEKFLAHERLQLDWLELDGRAAAAEFKLLGGDTLYYYQVGMDPALAAESPGWLLQIASLRRAIDDGCRWFDFLRGDEEYKASWGARPFALVEARIVSRRPAAQWRHRLWLAGSRVKHWRGKKPNAIGDCSAGNGLRAVP